MVAHIINPSTQKAWALLYTWQVKITYSFDPYCVCDGVAKESLVYNTKLGWREE